MILYILIFVKIKKLFFLKFLLKIVSNQNIDYNRKKDFLINMILLWLDLEMTGLNPINDKILEIACIATDQMLNELFTYHTVIKQSQFTIMNMNEICYNMHKKTNLINKVLMSKKTIKQAETDIIKLITSFIQKEQIIYLAGNSIHCDYSFIKKYMPELKKNLHYRLFDVSTLKILAEITKLTPYLKEKKHEALADIKESINEYKYYKKFLFC